jgi:hypothetical protein
VPAGRQAEPRPQRAPRRWITQDVTKEPALAVRTILPQAHGVERDDAVASAAAVCRCRARASVAARGRTVWFGRARSIAGLTGYARFGRRMYRAMDRRRASSLLGLVAYRRVQASSWDSPCPDSGETIEGTCTT